MKTNPAIFNTCFDNNANFNTCFNNNQRFNTTMDIVSIIRTGKIVSDTVAGWNAQASLIAEKNVLYVYTDYRQIEEDGELKNVPGLKVGDGKAYLIDIPFTDAFMAQHMSDGSIHVTLAEKEFWNNKVRCFVDVYDDSNLVFTTL